MSQQNRMPLPLNQMSQLLNTEALGKQYRLSERKEKELKKEKLKKKPALAIIQYYTP